MHHPLSLCPSCARHVRAGSLCCPFCAAALGSHDGHDRRAAVALAAFAWLIAGCNSAFASDPPRGSSRPPDAARATDASAPDARPVAPRPRRPARPPEMDRDQPMYGMPDYKEGEVLAHCGPPPGTDDEPR